MNNLHRELAPISDSAWAQIEEETSRTLKRYLAGRRVVDLKGPAGAGLSAVGTGHLRTIAAPAKGIIASLSIRQGTSNPIMSLPADVREYPDAIAQSLSQLRLVGVNGPYTVLLGADAYTALAETSDHGYPVLEHVKRLVKDQIIWAPAIVGAFVLTTRGGDFDLHIGQDVSIGYLSHTDAAVRLYLQETFTFLLLTAEAAVALAPSTKAKKA
jgi:uncharacterized linocin/CFP29 family protein